MRKSARALFVWDSGSVIVLVLDLLTPQQAGTQCPGSTWKKYHPPLLLFLWFNFKVFVDSHCGLNDHLI